MKKLIFVLILLTFACGGTVETTTIITPIVSSDPTKAPTDKPIGKIGETVIQGDYAITAQTAEVKKTDKGKSVSVELIITSNADSGVSVNPLFVSVKDSNGYEYNAALFDAKQPTLKSQNDLPKGDKVRGWLTFEVPADATGLVMTYKPMLSDLRIQFELPSE